MSGYDLKVRSITVSGSPAATGDITFAGDVIQTGNTFTVGSGGAPLTDGDKGDITVSSSGTTWTIDNGVVNDNKISGVGWNKISGTPTTVSGYGITDAIDGSGANTRVPFFTDSNTLSSDSHFYYNSTDDILHIHKLSGDATDGLIIESESGTDIGILGAANTANVTWYGNHNYDTATANTIASFGASKTLSSLSTATYPDLTELSYVKGVTSAIQTQLGNKQPLDTQLTDLAGLSYTGNALKYIRVNAGENGVELATVSSSGSPGGSDTEVQFNDGGTFGAEATFTYNKTTNVLTVDNISSNAGAGLTIFPLPEVIPADLSISGASTTSTGNQAGGDVRISGGIGAGSSHGGHIIIMGGDGDLAAGETGSGGDVSFTGGVGSENGDGGDLNFDGGSGGFSSGAGGKVDIAGGNTYDDSDGGSVFIYGGDSASGTDGNVVLGNPGKVLLQKLNSSFETTLDVEYLTEGRIVKFPDSNGQISLTGQILAQLSGMANL